MPDVFAERFAEQAARRLASIISSHDTAIRRSGRQPLALLIHEQEAGRWGLTGMTALLGIPVEHDATMELGCCRLRLDDGTRYHVDLPVYFTEN